MGNQLLQQARDFVEKLKGKKDDISEEDIEKAKNAISSAFKNSTMAEQELLSQYQKELEELEIR